MVAETLVHSSLIPEQLRPFPLAERIPVRSVPMNGNDTIRILGTTLAEDSRFPMHAAQRGNAFEIYSNPEAAFHFENISNTPRISGLIRAGEGIHVEQEGPLVLPDAAHVQDGEVEILKITENDPSREFRGNLSRTYWATTLRQLDYAQTVMGSEPFNVLGGNDLRKVADQRFNNLKMQGFYPFNAHEVKDIVREVISAYAKTTPFSR